jgi:hypothetical protein
MTMPPSLAQQSIGSEHHHRDRAIMNVTFHALAGLAIAHVAAVAPRSSQAGASPRFVRHVLVALAAVASHGVLDGLPHTYPVPSPIDVLVAPCLVLAWSRFVEPSFRALFITSLFGAVLPDVIDLGPSIVARLCGIGVPTMPHLFPWHWPAGSGSIYSPTPTQAIVSAVNHAIVIALSIALIVTHREAFHRRRPMQ